VPDIPVFGDRLRAGRVDANLSQEELAAQSGVSVRAISDLERGRTRWPHPGSVHRLADALRLTGQTRTEFISSASRRLPRAAPSKASHVHGGRVALRQLPPAVLGFAGRSAELAVLSRMLDQPGGTALITAIGGTAGVGKTALAVYWGHQVASEFPDGQLFVNLRGFDPGGVPLASADGVVLLLEALGIAADRLPSTVEAQIALYRSLVAGKRMLVLLDNAHDEAQVRPLLPGSLTCRVVVTSRNRLAGLVAVEAAHPLMLDVLTSAEARELLCQRLGADRISADPDATARIITSCAYLPLALSVIAARAAMAPGLSLAQIADELAVRRDLDGFSTGGDVSADVRAVLSWSYQQLDADAARTFRLAGLHPGQDVDLYAAAAVTRAPLERARKALDLLVRECLIQQAGPGRYRMHDLLRSYARELAAQEPEAIQRAALSALLGYYLHTASVAMDAVFPAERNRRPRIEPPDTPAPPIDGEIAGQAWLDEERASLVASAAYAADNGWPDYVTRLSATLWRYLDTGGYFREGRALHGQAAGAARSVGDLAAEATALIVLGFALAQLGERSSAAASYERALVLSGQAGDTEVQARALNYLGVFGMREGHYREAASRFERAAELYRLAGNLGGLAYALCNLGVVDSRQGRHELAIDHQEQALAVFRELGDRHGEAQVLYTLGMAGLRHGTYKDVFGSLDQSLALFREFGDRQGETSALTALGLACVRQGDYEQAERHLLEALEALRELNDQSGQAEVLNGLGDTFLGTGRLAGARGHYTAALDLARQVHERSEEARAHAGLARAYDAEGEFRKAHRHWREALTRYTEFGGPEAEQIRARLAAGGAREPENRAARAS
jgi:tetratricopeptide (TPR) repeat protein/transcriptional regulator with XRE-family HTH domain